jgi:hypothetical protein
MFMCAPFPFRFFAGLGAVVVEVEAAVAVVVAAAVVVVAAAAVATAAAAAVAALSATRRAPFLPATVAMECCF